MSHYPQPIEIRPIPPNPEDRARWEHTGLRRRMLYGLWEQDLVRRLELAIGHIRRDAWGPPDLSTNVFRSSVTALATLYDRAPTVAGGTPELVDEAARASLWGLMQRVQRDTLGLREMFVVPDVTADGMTFRAVSPDSVIATPDPERPGQFRDYRELRRWSTPKGVRWVWDWYDVDGTRRIVDCDDTSKVWSETPAMRWSDGRPLIPAVIYHAAQTGMLWDPYELAELVEGSLNCAVLWTFFGHTVRNASWPQRYAVGVRLQGVSQEGRDPNDNRRDAIVTDPATVLLFEHDPDSAQAPQLSQWTASADPAALQDAIALYERRVAGYAGINPADVQRVAGDARSGFAIALNRDAQRDAMRRFTPTFRASDERLLATVAALCNNVRGTAYAETGYRVIYESLPPSPEERAAEREQVDWELDKDYVSPIDGYIRLNPGTPREDAQAAILANRLEKLRLDVEAKKLAEQLGLAPKPPQALPAPVEVEDGEDDAAEDAAESETETESEVMDG